MKKRLLTMLLCATTAISLCACGGSNTNETPAVTQMAEYADLNQVLSGEYAVTDELISVYFTEVLADAGVGLMEVTDRNTVQEGDIVKADYTGYKDGEAFEGGAAKEQWLDVSNNSGFDVSTGAPAGGFIDGFTDGLIGAKVGEKVESDVTFPEQYHSSDLAGQPAVFEFYVHGIYTPVTLENITDAFVAENLAATYEVSTVAEFMEFLEKELSYNFVMNYLIQNTTFEIPDSYIDSRVADYQAYFEELYCGETPIEEYLSYYGYSLETMQEEWAAAVESQVKAELAFEKVVADNNLTLDEEGHKEYVEKIVSVNSAYFPDADSIHKYAGAGNAETGEKYLKTQTAVREYMLENIRNTVME